MKKYTHLFFDLDHTLWDYNTNATETLFDLVDRYQIINGHPVDHHKFVQQFFIVNEGLWAKFDKGQIDKEYIRKHRFPYLLNKLGIEDFENVEKLQEDFIRECPTRGNLIPGAKEIVPKLAQRYSLFIITNGFDEIQHTKMKFSGLEEYFEEIITSESAKAQKPDPKIFTHSIRLAKADPNSCMMIGDNFNSDILGAKNSGIDQVYFNPDGRDNGYVPTYEISNLLELSDILL